MDGAAADAAAAPPSTCGAALKGPQSVLEQLQQTAQKLSAAAEAEAGAAKCTELAEEEEGRPAAAERVAEEGDEQPAAQEQDVAVEGGGPAGPEEQPEQRLGASPLQAMAGQASAQEPSPFAGESFMAAVSPLKPVLCPELPLAAAAAALAATAAEEARSDEASALADNAGAGLEAPAWSAAACMLGLGPSSPGALPAAMPSLFGGTPLPLAAGPDAEAAEEGAAAEQLSQMAPWSPTSSAAWQQLSPQPAARAVAAQPSPQPPPQDDARVAASVPTEAPAEEVALALVQSPAERAEADSTDMGAAGVAAAVARALASAPASPALLLPAAEALQPPATAPAPGRSFTRQLVRTLTAQRESGQAPRLLLRVSRSGWAGRPTARTCVALHRLVLSLGSSLAAACSAAVDCPAVRARCSCWILRPCLPNSTGHTPTMREHAAAGGAAPPAASL